MLPKRYGDKIGVEQDGQLVVRIIHGLGEIGPSKIGPETEDEPS